MDNDTISATPVPGHEPSLLPSGRKFRLAWNDEFDGDALDESKWGYRGYYECRCRTQRKAGWWSAFWMQTPMQGCSLDPRRAGVEHDIMESFESGEVLPHWFHAGGYGADHLGFTAPRRPKGMTMGEFNRLNPVKLGTADFHRFGLLWEPDGYTLFIDGRRHGEKIGGGEGEAVSQVEEFLLVTTEAKWYRNKGMTGEGVPELEEAWQAGDAFEVDYVRVFDEDCGAYSSQKAPRR